MGGWTRMEKYLVEHGSHVPRPVIQLFLDLCQICQATRGRKRTQKRGFNVTTGVIRYADSEFDNVNDMR